MGGGMMYVPPEKAESVKLPTVCLDHGKAEPRPTMPYEIRPIDSVTDKPAVWELCRMLGRRISQRVAQAAAWHLNNNMSWDQLAAKQARHIGGGGSPYLPRRNSAGPAHAGRGRGHPNGPRATAATEVQQRRQRELTVGPACRAGPHRPESLPSVCPDRSPEGPARQAGPYLNRKRHFTTPPPRTAANASWMCSTGKLWVMYSEARSFPSRIHWHNGPWAFAPAQSRGPLMHQQVEVVGPGRFGQRDLFRGDDAIDAYTDPPSFTSGRPALMIFSLPPRR